MDSPSFKPNFLSSYSGNTEETLSCYEECTSRNSFNIIMTSGGELLRLGISRGALAAMGPVGWAGLAASLGWTGYEQYQDYKKGRGFFASDDE